MRENTITLTFVDDETAKYVRLVCTRKNITLEDYIIDNFEWDDKLICITTNEMPNVNICPDCEYVEDCPDKVMK